MKPFIHDDFTITCTETPEGMIMIWKGQITVEKPAPFLMPYLQQVLDEAAGHTLKIHCEFITFMNSPTIRVLLQFLARLNMAGIETTVTYNGQSSWQRMTFKVLATFCETMQHISVQAAR